MDIALEWRKENTMPLPRPRRRQLLVWAGVLAALAAVFLSYLQPSLIVDLGNRLWSCF
jgi:type II secretory pathway component PulM